MGIHASCGIPTTDRGGRRGPEEVPNTVKATLFPIYNYTSNRGIEMHNRVHNHSNMIVYVQGGFGGVAAPQCYQPNQLSY